MIVVIKEKLSFYSDVWSSVFLHSPGHRESPGHRAGLTSRDSMRDMLRSPEMKYMEKLVPLSEMVLDRELVSIFRDTLRDGSRPSALTLLKYPALKNLTCMSTTFRHYDRERE
ncbi:hypothetical protein GBAR_LOCUS14881 [Geodia barretti]|uniref:Uncharacterized protein n=1 Tax=Geodia barretti TaxID=519541 RepID=A0AA35SB08_GEOBA|nr:hypothetical protein GBAR_LOCUS14881 [Geodia barretti]